MDAVYKDAYFCKIGDRACNINYLVLESFFKHY